MLYMASDSIILVITKAEIAKTPNNFAHAQIIMTTLNNEQWLGS